MPILVVALGVFKRPKFKEWVYAVIALVAYFCAMLFANAYFSVKYNTECDFFFLNSDHIVSQLGEWAERTRDIVVNVPLGEYTLTFYPLYQALFIGIYILFTVAIWFLYAVLFTSWDKANDRRQRERDYKRMKKDLKKYLGGKPETEPVSGDDSPSLVLKHFSKRYGANKHYSVNDVSFEVKGGEIFGFLGPNGAGKSTIIKSIVGIQTITSGNIEVCGYDVEKQSVQAKHELGFVPDHYALYENLTGREYINYIADLYGVSKKDRDERIEHDVFRIKA
jgi:ABC-type multidrug transport system fused ATPase/permease subunit